MGRKIINPTDLIDKRFGRLVVSKIDHVEVYKDKRGGKHNVVTYLCKCDCGNEKKVKKVNLLNGSTNSCGCFRKECKTKHGMRHTRFYHIYVGMKSRCHNINDTTYHLYGARGIVVCNRWQGENGFEHFKEDMYDEYVSKSEIYGENNISLDRIDVNGNYEPNNCRWVTTNVQANNKRTNLYVEYNGEKMSLATCVHKYGDARLNYNLIYRRIVEKGYNVERAISEIPTVYKGTPVVQPISFTEPHLTVPFKFKSLQDNNELIYPFRNK